MDRPTYIELEKQNEELKKKIAELEGNLETVDYQNINENAYENLSNEQTISNKNLNSRVSQNINVGDLLKKAIEAEEKNKIYSDIIHYMQLGLMVLKLEKDKDKESLVVSTINPAVEKMLGLNKESIINKSIDSILPKLIDLGIPKIFSDVIKTGNSIEFDNIAYEDDRIKLANFAIKAFPINTDSVSVLIEDITEFVKTEDALMKTRSDYHALFTEMTIGFALHEIITDISGIPLDYTYLDVNPAFERITNSVANKTKGKTILEVNPNIDKFWIITFGDVALKGISKQFEIFSSELNKYLHISAFSPQYGQVAAIYEDISKRKLAELELIKTKEQAIESDRLKSAFLANMSHEIRTPMNGIVGFASLLEKDNLLPEKKKKYVKLIQSSAEQLLALISDIIDLSKIEANQIEIKNGSLNLNNLFDELFAQIEIEKQKKEKTKLNIIVYKSLSDNYCYVNSDEIRLKQILGNLLTNALKFTDEGNISFGYTILSSSLTNTNNEIQFFVKDTGIGISKQNHKIIFERFRQEDDSNTRKFGGTGLGLSISKGLVELMGGHIWVESEKGQGADFYFTIPYVPEENYKKRAKTQSPPEDMKYNWPGKKILFVDDLSSIFEYFSELLIDTHALCLYAESGRQAIELCKTHPDLDLVLMDIQLSDINGYDATKQIKSFRSNLPVVAQTAYALAGDREKALKAGFDDYIAKPLSRNSLMELINKYVSSNIEQC